MARARVRITVEIFKQAADSAVNALRQGVTIDLLRSHHGSGTPATIIGKPEVTAILLDEDKQP